MRLRNADDSGHALARALLLNEEPDPVLQDLALDRLPGVVDRDPRALGHVRHDAILRHGRGWNEPREGKEEDTEQSASGRGWKSVGGVHPFETNKVAVASQRG